MYAIIELAGHQYKVSPGDELLVNKLKGEPSPKVLLLRDENGLKVGNPYLDSVKVSLSVVGQVKGEKIRGFKYKAKKRYRRRWGTRPVYTKIKVDTIELL